MNPFNAQRTHKKEFIRSFDRNREKAIQYKTQNIMLELRRSVAGCMRLPFLEIPF